MNKVANTYWDDSRLAGQRPSARTLALAAQVSELPRGFGSATAASAGARRRGALLPSWVLFSTIILATFALCVTVTMRTHAGMRSAAARHERMSADVETLRRDNEAIRRQVERLRTDSRAVEAAARERLHMLRADEFVVPVE